MGTTVDGVPLGEATEEAGGADEEGAGGPAEARAEAPAEDGAGTEEEPEPAEDAGEPEVGAAAQGSQEDG